MTVEHKTPLNKEGLLKRAYTKQVELPNGDIVCIRALSSAFIVDASGDSGNAFETANLLVNSLCDESGALMFSEAEKGEVMQLDLISLNVLMDAIVDFNGLSRGDKDGKEDKAEKN